MASLPLIVAYTDWLSVWTSGPIKRPLECGTGLPRVSGGEKELLRELRADSRFAYRRVLVVCVRKFVVIIVYRSGRGSCRSRVPYRLALSGRPASQRVEGRLTFKYRFGCSVSWTRCFGVSEFQRRICAVSPSARLLEPCGPRLCGGCNLHEISSEYGGGNWGFVMYFWSKSRRFGATRSAGGPRRLPYRSVRMRGSRAAVPWRHLLSCSFRLCD